MELEFRRVVFFGRSAAECLEMYGLAPAQWLGASVLDCPGGPGSLAAVLGEVGLDVTAVDPWYGASPECLDRQARGDIALAMEQIAAADHLAAGFDLKAYRTEKHRALEAFLADYGRRPQRYVQAALPVLPFADASFDLVLSGHLLFSYAPLDVGGLMPTGGFDFAWHRRAIAELMRVCRREVRIYPAHTLQGLARRHPYAEALLAELPAGWAGRFQPSRYVQGHIGSTEGLHLERLTPA
ncbi:MULTISPECIES: class I SAM-dependent methyltransferase [unclassified Synechococcus]|uniref:class I SAM-dependent methyltransferase n=1 Tax=unclassified Synechococcus TaxID=2626047 RepID=UPI0021A324C2|nr:MULTISPECIES: class I SAM-dependent methyltransferase [unclassified Synechococcus]MCT0213153.1 class I SAM-dependent methyltransferase [Synechococcus sp. CS-1326]MCT0233041.1 class I SAM-dependent methyltransferase [Synechococcus sp. CS-1327]